jgi:hypothetical protein
MNDTVEWRNGRAVCIVKIQRECRPASLNGAHTAKPDCLQKRHASVANRMLSADHLSPVDQVIVSITLLMVSIFDMLRSRNERRGY